MCSVTFAALLPRVEPPRIGPSDKARVRHLSNFELRKDKCLNYSNPRKYAEYVTGSEGWLEVPDEMEMRHAKVCPPRLFSLNGETDMWRQKMEHKNIGHMGPLS